MIMYLQISAGFILLILAAEILICGAVSLADRYGISPLVIGMTVVAIGTPAPELVVSLNLILEGSSGLTIGNFVVSNITNVLLILGASCFLKPVNKTPGSNLVDGWVLLAGSQRL
jgi:cation:H+ antiporter